MQAATGTVVEVTGTHAVVACSGVDQCARCAAGQGCGGALMGRLLGDRLHLVNARLPTDAMKVRKGDSVTLGICGDALMMGAAAAYLVPLGGLLAGASLVATVLPASGDAGALAGAIVGLLLGLGSARRLCRRLVRRYELVPQVLACHGSGHR